MIVLRPLDRKPAGPVTTLYEPTSSSKFAGLIQNQPQPVVVFFWFAGLIPNQPQPVGGGWRVDPCRNHNASRKLPRFTPSRRPADRDNGRRCRARPIDAAVVQAGHAGLVPQPGTCRAGEAAIHLRLAAVHQGGALVALARTTPTGLAPQWERWAGGAHRRGCALALAHNHLGPQIEVCSGNLNGIKASLPRQMTVQLVSWRSRAERVFAFSARDAELPMHVAPCQRT